MLGVWLKLTQMTCDSTAGIGAHIENTSKEGEAWQDTCYAKSNFFFMGSFDRDSILIS